ncbi:MAG: caspase family protein [Bacteroidetes bacterium]|jgi:hypothetical protein|nr:caspase family protein [Bacteroidota bacterium]MDF1867926.1 caspase family protein [Saprospiraceae bacterium]
MATKNLYALLIGIQKYHPSSSVPPLSGCEKDVRNINMLLTELYADEYNLYIQKLQNEAATYENVIAHFRDKHLQKEDGNERDVILVYYSGHGSREKAADEFRDYFPDGFGETMVCYDSRKKENGVMTGLDLADKELAVLISELDKICPHVTVMMDCCHSGGGTKDTNYNDEEVKINWESSRQSSDRKETRKLNSYLNGFYENQLKMDGKINIPESRHILLSACSNIQTAYEIQSKQGLFTNRLLKVLLSEKQISYADLFSKCRLAMRRVTKSQDPQFETSNRFDGTDNFLNIGTKKQGNQHSIFYEDNSWWIDCGAIHGLSTDEDKEGIFAVSEGDKKLGYAHTKSVGIQKSELELEFTGSPGKFYKGVMTSLAALPILMRVNGDSENQKRLNTNLKSYQPIHFQLDSKISTSKFQLKLSEYSVEIWDTERSILIRKINGNDDSRVFKDVFEWLEHLAEWEKTLNIRNAKTKFDSNNMNFLLTVYDGKNNPQTYSENEITLYPSKIGNQYEELRFELRVENNCGQEVHCSLFYFSPDYAIYFVDYRVIPNNRAALFMEDTLTIIEGKSQSTEQLKIFVGTEKMDDFLLEMSPKETGETVNYTVTRNLELAGQKAIGSFYKEKKKIIVNDWFTKSLKILLIGKS